MGSTHRHGLRLTLATILIAACGGEPPASEPPEVTAAEAEPVQDTTVQAVPAITIRPVSNIEPERFPHYAHEIVECSTCHTAIPGHGRHATLACAECHTAPVGERARPTAAECNACHHGPAQTRTCTECHRAGVPATLQVDVAARFSVRPAATSLSLPFDHQRHGAEACSACHSTERGVTTIRECAGCHDSHHDEARRCLTCHTTPALPLHGRDAHLGCGGAGCHQDATVAALEQTRPVCVVCHVQQEDHEAGRDCALCHLFDSPDPRAHARPDRGGQSP